MITISERLQSILERRAGHADETSRDAAFQAMSKTCPPVDPHLVAHLRQVFKDGGIKPAHPQLTQLLQIQYGCNMIIDYLTARYDQQSAVARERHGI